MFKCNELKNYDAIIQAKDDEIRRLNNLYADTIKDLGDALIEIERLKSKLKHYKELASDLGDELREAQYELCVLKESNLLKGQR